MGFSGVGDDMKHMLQSDGISATIKVDGAELCSLKNKQGLELLWQAGPSWPRYAPILFPIVGRLKKMISCGTEARPFC
jgi:hypothetical protein